MPTLDRVRVLLGGGSSFIVATCGGSIDGRRCAGARTPIQCWRLEQISDERMQGSLELATSSRQEKERARVRKHELQDRFRADRQCTPPRGCGGPHT